MTSNPELWFQRAFELHNKKDLKQAEDLYKKILQVRPRHYETLLNFGNLQRQIGKAHLALPLYQQAISIKPLVFEGYFNLGIALFDLSQFEAATKALKLALKYNSDYPEALLMLGHALRKINHFEEARSAFEALLRISPEKDKAQMGLGYTYHESLHLPRALELYNAVLIKDPGNADAHWNKATLLLLQGEFKEGWKEFEWRKKLPNYPKFGFDQPEWDGSDLNGKRILLVSEQGYGDSIQFLRFSKFIKERGGYVIISTTLPLLELFRSCPYVDHVKLTSEKPVPFDTYASLMSLPAILSLPETDLPAKVPYFLIPSEEIEPPLINKNKLRVGLSWGGNPLNRNDRNRSCLLKSWQPFLNLSGIQFYSFQLGPQQEELNNLSFTDQIIDLSNHLISFMDTARYMQHMDLMITVDSASAHLAGAMGKKVWLTLPCFPDWRWLLARKDSPWYPTMRIFRQKSPGNWAEVVQQIETELVGFRSHFPDDK